jgi:cytochrome c oxidase subunit II
MIKLLAYVTIILALVLVFQLMRIYQLSAELKGKHVGKADDGDNRTQGLVMLLFVFALFGCLIWLLFDVEGKMLPPAASDVGVTSDSVFLFNWVIIFIVFFITTFLLFYFPFRYKKQKSSQAYFYPHNDKIELIWTVVPSIALAVIIIYGLSLWAKMTGPPDPKAMVIQVYAKQFDWTVRYAGADNVLGKSDYRLIDDASNNTVGMDSTDPSGWDDIMVKGEFHIPVNQPILFKCNARDVMHGVFMPHFRDQINCMPGITTELHFTPTVTTDDMRKQMHDSTFDYVLLCNRVCGSGHYNMPMKIVVDSPDEFQQWMAKQHPFFSRLNDVHHKQAVATAMK